MKNMKKALFIAGCLASFAQADTIIKVTTELDENGSNASACSLREALHVVNDKAKKAWGGCPAASNVGDIIIQLDDKTYELTLGELQVLGNVVIAGKSTLVEDDESTPVDESLNPHTGTAPYRKLPVSIIDGLGTARIVNSYGTTGTNLTFKDVVLRNGNADYASNQGNGGAIYAAMSVSLDNVRIENSVANGQLNGGSYRGGMGGAIYLSTSGAGLALSNTTLVGNEARGAGGGAVAMVCEENLELATHPVSIANSLLEANRAINAGAGALQACGSASISISSSTLAANASQPGHGALSFLPTRAGQGTLAISSMTAAANTGAPALALGNISVVTLNSSAIMGNPGGACSVATDASFKTGNYNAIEGLASCERLLVPPTIATYENADAAVGSFASNFLPLGDHGGLTKVYLPRDVMPSYVLNKGMPQGNCSTDQRGFPRQSGACDIGAAERQTVTANDDSGESGSNFERAAIIDVLANDAFGEGDGEGDTGYNKYADPAVTVLSTDIIQDANGNPVLDEDGNTIPVCQWYGATATREEYRNRLVISNGRVITAEGSPINCNYQINVMPNGGGAEQHAVALATASIRNIAPKAVADVIVRPVGVQTITVDVLANDTDVDDSNGSLAIPIEVIDINGNPVAKYPLIYVSSQPQLGHLEGTQVDCPDNSASNVKRCYQLPLRYVASNPQSPFTDSFQYAVYDEDDKASNTTTATIKTDAPNPDRGETGGSADLAGLALLALLGLRRARKL